MTTAVALRRLVRRGRVLGMAALLGGCAYFNALYNARQEFDDAERYRAQGEHARADQTYLRSAEKAAKSFEQDPAGRWADDALYLLARAHFERRAYPEARAALRRLLTVSEDGAMRAGASMYLGAAELRLEDLEAAREHLDAALASEDASRDTRAFALLWRGRAKVAAGNLDGGWSDVAEAAGEGGRAERDARLEAVRMATLSGDVARAGEATGALVERGFADESADTLFALADSAAALWGPEVAAALLEPLEASSWPDDRRSALALTRARLAAGAGDTVAAIEHARRSASLGAGTAANQARLSAARWMLATTSRVDDLREIRAILLPALAFNSARVLVQEVEMLGVLIETGLNNRQPLALFTAGEIARDELAAPGVARSIFLAQLERHPRDPWSMKAALAASQLDPAEPERARIDAALDGAAGDPYVAAARGQESERYGQLETQLGRMVTGFRQWGREEAERRDGLVLQTVLMMDSIRGAVELDSLTSVCGLLLDSLSVEAGLLADSTLAACIRRDTLRVDSILRGDVDLTPDSAEADTSFFPPPPDSIDEDTGGSGTGQSAALRLGGFRPAP
ncbi:MAG: hypothetical protein ABFS34_04090 [Gemmatimonadota bacterium]